jgi:hypothetical protein
LFEVLDVFGGLKVSPVAWTSFMGPKVKKIAIFVQKTKQKFICFSFFNFWSSNSWIRKPYSLEMLNPDLMNRDLQHYNRVNKLSLPEE